MRKLKFFTLSAAVFIVFSLPACGLSSNETPSVLEVPEDVFPDGGQVPQDFNPDDSLDLDVGTTVHPVYFLLDSQIIEVKRRLLSPVFLEAPLNNLLIGPSPIEAATGLESAIPEGTEIVNVQVSRNNIVTIHLNANFFALEGAQRIRATAQLVFTGLGLVTDAQGVLFLLDGIAQQLPDSRGIIAEKASDGFVQPLTEDDFAPLREQSKIS
ncbi:MAG: hypothetical protein CL504_05025 [Actinobacteria bacterium]|jgi:hypothetical protein|nr:hypothetical protein [Actinomycetota bacterium]